MSKTPLNMHYNTEYRIPSAISQLGHLPLNVKEQITDSMLLKMIRYSETVNRIMGW